MSSEEPKPSPSLRVPEKAPMTKIGRLVSRPLSLSSLAASDDEPRRTNVPERRLLEPVPLERLCQDIERLSELDHGANVDRSAHEVGVHELACRTEALRGSADRPEALTTHVKLVDRADERSRDRRHSQLELRLLGTGL